jgi:hypothetical protein
VLWSRGLGLGLGLGLRPFFAVSVLVSVSDPLVSVLVSVSMLWSRSWSRSRKALGLGLDKLVLACEFLVAKCQYVTTTNNFSSWSWTLVFHFTKKFCGKRITVRFPASSPNQIPNFDLEIFEQ